MSSRAKSPQSWIADLPNDNCFLRNWKIGKEISFNKYADSFTQKRNALTALLYSTFNKTKLLVKMQSNVNVLLTQIEKYENTMVSKIAKPNFLFHVVLVLKSETTIMILNLYFLGAECLWKNYVNDDMLLARL
jgi:hypothetical protein